MQTSNESSIKRKYREITDFDLIEFLCSRYGCTPNHIINNYSWVQILLMLESCFYNTPSLDDDEENSEVKIASTDKEKFNAERKLCRAFGIPAQQIAPMVTDYNRKHKTNF